MVTKDVAGVGTSVTDGACECSVDDDESASAEGGVRDERFYAWHALLEAIDGQTSPSDAGRRRVRDRIAALIHQADEGGVEKVDLMVELADMAAALMMRIHEDPFAGLVQVHRMLVLRRAPA
jgi:hypothetical protein